MRKLSYVLAVLSWASVGLSHWYAKHAAAAYEAQRSAPVEGIGLVGIWVVGLRAFMLLATLGFACAVLAYRNENAPRRVTRLVEVSLFLLPILVIVSLVTQMVPTLAGTIYLLTGIRM